MSICSHKVRMTLAEKGLPYISLEVRIAHQENYNPVYANLRLASDVARNTKLASNYSGSSGVQDTGFDAWVVPTLVDVEKNSIIADSRLICLYLCQVLSLHGVDRDELLPSDIETEVLAQLDKVDSFPHVALFYGPNPDGDRRPSLFREASAGAHERKIAALKATWESVRGENAELDAAYAAKISKESAASAFVTNPDRMRTTIANTDQLVGELGKILAASGGTWCFGDRFTLADIFWIVTLFRLEFLGYGWLWQERSDRAHISRYAEAGYARNSMKYAVRHWPGSCPYSEWIAKWLPTK
ncbi:MAG: glutathione S-transferase family protein [Okeania sp. SIO3I5]|uniref:glutathione S-transferase family protein n=1 Tax=Okeania sp. SIO3I5 TaxID=2607805 RepID=UPI0013B81ECF|nr:glutathione S-transferase family protein [Okeania sp. SIO3I5]NEQ40973.1 glutathione S-transferase family protein [Okeania sp. SIO3I5]